MDLSIFLKIIQLRFVDLPEFSLVFWKVEIKRSTDFRKKKEAKSVKRK